MKKLLSIIGARPQFIKHVMFEKACEDKLNLVTLHTGQHFDENMSEVFFSDLEIKKPKYTLTNGGGHHGEQTGKMMIEIESIVLNEKPDAIIVYGDTNSTLAGALVASKLHIPLAHIESGLRSHNHKMPEEINRKLTDHISNWLFCPGENARLNLSKEGLMNGVYVTGDIMKDLLNHAIEHKRIQKPDLEKSYYYCTIHRPYNADSQERLEYILDSLQILKNTVVFSMHPRTKLAMQRFRLDGNKYSNIKFIEPQSYFQNLGFIQYSNGLITDSGGMQKEAYWLNKACITIRTETEWKETLTDYANVLMFSNLDQLQIILDRTHVKFDSSLYGNGDTCNRIINVLSDELNIQS